MTDKNIIDIDELITNEEIVTEALRKGAREAMKRHIAAGVPMVSWDDGKVVEISTEKLAEMLQEELPENSRI
ncbi:hypothetical protein LJB86_02580 [Deltaproteobacteria bacterium OttesenSCG-928-M10]|nr:hypothetical protein [Deltaproteobacteria bacterium OttesenSCG-928-M10]